MGSSMLIDEMPESFRLPCSARISKLHVFDTIASTCHSLDSVSASTSEQTHEVSLFETAHADAGRQQVKLTM